MTDQMAELIKEIAVKHHIALDREDPILILHTLNARLMKENTETQQEMLNQYKIELETLANLWCNDAKEKSERILNTSIVASKEAVATVLQDSITATTKAIQHQGDELLNKVKRLMTKTERAATMNLIASLITVSSLFIMSFLFYLMKY